MSEKMLKNPEDIFSNPVSLFFSSVCFILRICVSSLSKACLLLSCLSG